MVLIMAMKRVVKTVHVIPTVLQEAFVCPRTGFIAEFDLLVYHSHDLTHLPLIERREIIRSALKFVSPRIRIAEYFETSAEKMLSAVRGQGLERVIAKRKNSRYEPGKRSGSWTKYRLNRGQELVIGGYVPGAHRLDSIINQTCRQKPHRVSCMYS